MAKIEFKPGTMLNPVPAVMVSCGDENVRNIITIAWTGIINSDPPMTYISVRKERYSYDIIKRTGEFVINLTTEQLAETTDYCGVRSGKDVDKFKEYNDTYGHHDGDRFLILVAQALNLALRKEDCACRMGGDEFAAALFFSTDTPEEVMQNRAQQIFDKINLTLKSVDDRTGISMGVAISRLASTFNQLYEASDHALYQAKAEGRGRMVIQPNSPQPCSSQ